MASSTEILLVPNQRLAQHHQAQHAKAQRADGLRSWDSAAIFALETWLLDMWQLQQANGVVPCCESWVLSGAQELQLWRQVLQQEASWMLAPESAAEEMMAAYRYCRQWDLDIAEEDALRSQFKLQEDSAFFLQCVDTFTRNCRERMAVASADLAVVLSQTPRPFADKITLLDFEELTPAVKKLCAAWGIDYAPQTIDVSLPSEASVLVCDEAQQELEEAAKWAAEILLKEKDFPNINIAVVVPGLESRREEVEQAFIQVFDAEYQLPLTPRHVLPFNITAGQRMTDLPMVQVALLLLQLNKGVIDVDRVPALLYSPFLCLGESLDALTVLEKRLRDFQDFRIQRSTLLTVCGSKGLDQEMLCPTLLQSLQQAMQLMAPFRSQRRSLVDWLALFADQLQLFGWPGERALDSVEYQQLQRWYELMAELPAVQLQAEALSWQAALNLMQFQLSHAVFQAQSQPSPLQIMGPLEAAGLPFSHLRLVGVDDRQLPALAAPSPFIPLQLQRDLDMPHASPERELRVAKRLLADLATNAKQISFSYARQSGQGEVQVSPLLRNLHSDSAIPDSQAAAMVQSEESGQSDLFGASLPLRNDRLAPELSEDEDIRGGVRVLENQALCPLNLLPSIACRHQQ
jgi:probable DNA repair protein